MRKLFLIFTLLFVLQAPVVADVASVDSSVAFIRDISVVVTMDQWHGSGVVIKHKDETYVLTAYHVIDKQNYSKRITKNGKSFYEDAKHPIYVLYRDLAKIDVATTYTYAAEAVEIAPFQDLALLKIVSKSHFTRGAKFKLDHEPTIGQRILHSGAMSLRQHYNMVTMGTLSQVSMRNSLPYGPRSLDFCTAPWYPGSSGGGVFNAQGEYIGMAIQWKGATVSIYNPIRNILTWAKTSKYGYLLGWKAPKKKVKQENSEGFFSDEELHKMFQDQFEGRNNGTKRPGANRGRKKGSHRSDVREW